MANNWTKEQTIVALSVYCRVPFNKANNSNKLIKEIAPLIGREPNALKMKIGNFGHLDSELKQKNIRGLSNVSKLDKDIWNEYCNDWERLAYDAEKILANMKHSKLEDSIGINEIPIGLDKDIIVKARINQNFFRSAVLASYENKCCITGLSSLVLLEACHIVDWSENISNRLNPSNGLCLNSLFHKAYDNYLIGISPDYEIYVSEELKLDNSKAGEFISQFDKSRIFLPTKFFPNRDLLDIHFKRFINHG